MVTGHQALRLQRCTDGASVIVNFAPGNECRPAVGIKISAQHRLSDEADTRAKIGSSFQTSDRGVDVNHGHRRYNVSNTPL